MQSQACDRCHRRKSRCGKQIPTCSDCEKAGVECTYTDRSREPTFRREHVEAIERRLRQAEAKNAALASELAKEKTRAIKATTENHSQGETAATGPQEASIQRNGQSSAQAPIAGDVINEVSFLASTAAGDRHYLGSTSGVLFASLLRGNVDSNASNLQTEQRARGDSGFNTVDSLSKLTSVASRESLPPEHLSRKLIGSYLAHDHLSYPFLSPSFILSLADLVYSDQHFYVNNAFDAFVFDMILAIANASIYKYDWQMLSSAESHHARAMLRINEVMQSGGLKSLQAILLLCQYRTSSSLQDTSASMWHLVGIAVRLALELGMHRESAYPLKVQDGIDSIHDERLIDQEVRRRCFWCVFAMDRVVSITLGRPLAINMDDIDVELPSIHDDNIINSQLLATVDQGQCSNRTAIFNHIVHYRTLCGRILKSLHGLKRSDHDEHEIAALRDKLANELEDWWHRSNDLDLPEANMSSTIPQHRSSFRSKQWYSVIYNNAMLMLFRPSPLLSDISKDSSTLEKIFTSSKQAVNGYAYLHRSRKINYSWITLHSVFMAGLSYIYAVSRHFRERRRPSPTSALLPSDPTVLEIVNDTRACSNVLVAVSERWNALRNCHEVFDRLSDAVLIDAVKLQSASPRQRQSAAPLPSTALPSPSSNDFSDVTQIPTNSTYAVGQQWYQPQAQNSPGMVNGFNSQTSPLAVDSAFRNCFDDLQQIYDQTFIDDPVMQLSQDWLGYLDGFDGILPLPTQPQFAVNIP